MKKQKITASFILFALIANLLFSCAKNENTDKKVDNNTPTQTQNMDSAETTTVKLLPELPESDFQGYTFKFLTHLYSGDDWVGTLPRELVAESENGEIINDAVYRRNETVSAKLHCEFDMIANTDEKNTLSKSVKAGDSAYDAVIIFNNNVPSVITADLLVQTQMLPYINLDKPWWDPAVKSMSIKDKNYLLGGDMLILDNEATNVLVFNKKLFADLNYELPYKTVLEGKWTFDKLAELLKGSSQDLDGDGEMSYKTDRYGLITFNDSLHAFFVAGGGLLAKKNADGVPEATFATPEAIAISDKAMDFLYNKQNVFNYQTTTEPNAINYHALFTEDRSLFMWIRMRVVEVFRNMESDFGIIPMPKFDEKQENYKSLVNPYTGVLMGVPKGGPDYDRTSIILEALAAESRYTLQPAYYETTLQRKFARDEESLEMLDIIFNSRVYDIGAVYAFGNVFLDYIVLAKTENRNVMSYYEKAAPKIEKAIEKVVVMIDKME